MKKLVLNQKELNGKDWMYKRDKNIYIRDFAYSLEQCYERPSYYKERAYEKCWDEILYLRDKYNLNIDYFKTGVAGYNSCTFTFQAVLYNNDIKVKIKITKWHNYFNIVEM